MREVNQFGVEVRMHAEVKDVVVGEDPMASEPMVAGGNALMGRGFQVRLADGRSLAADFVCIACGGSKVGNVRLDPADGAYDRRAGSFFVYV